MVIGPAIWREIELKYAFGTMRWALGRLMSTGVIGSGSPDLLASILLGTLVEAARGIGRAEEKQSATDEARRIVDRFLVSLRGA